MVKYSNKNILIVEINILNITETVLQITACSHVTYFKGLTGFNSCCNMYS